MLVLVLVLKHHSNITHPPPTTHHNPPTTTHDPPPPTTHHPRIRHLKQICLNTATVYREREMHHRCRYIDIYVNIYTYFYIYTYTYKEVCTMKETGFRAQARMTMQRGSWLGHCSIHLGANFTPSVLMSNPSGMVDVETRPRNSTMISSC